MAVIDSLLLNRPRITVYGADRSDDQGCRPTVQVIAITEGPIRLAT